MPAPDQSRSAPVLFIPHGGGPLPLLDDPGHRELADFLPAIGLELGRPEAIIVISAHWEAEQASLTSGAQPDLVYDYYGFPPESYQISYPAPGNPQLAHRLWQLMQDQSLDAVLEPGRGFDHGLFVPLKLMYPDADVPCIQLSLLNSLDPLAHIRIGEALRLLRKENILILGSGFSFHNMRAFFSADSADRDTRNEAFERWLIDTCTRQDLPEEKRRQRLVNWEQAPHASYCHPRAEHLLPLHVCYGIAGTPAHQVFNGRVIGKQASAFLW